MIGTQPSLTFTDATAPGGIRGPLINVDGVANTEPGGIGMVSHLLGQSELAFQQRRAATGVHHPTSLDLPFAALVEDPQAMRVALGLQANLLHLAAIEKGNPLRWE